ncbi:hypothetical protein DAI22_01g345700 [Oryza sativa Japonica Group]|nr:hypothetical protein DAI22_01g345700 [Oryza sativa Japonica Group]
MAQRDTHDLGDIAQHGGVGGQIGGKGGSGRERVGVGGDGEAAVGEALASALRDLGPERLHQLRLVREQREPRGRRGVAGEHAVHHLRPHVPPRGLQEQALVEPPPDVLGGVDEVLGARRRRVEPDPPAGRGGRCGGGSLGGRRERREGVGDAGEVAGDGVGGLLDEEYRVRGVEEVAVAAADELAELLLLGGDLAARGALRRADLRDASRAEQLLGVGRAAAGDCRGRHRRLDLGARGEIQEGSDRD